MISAIRFLYLFQLLTPLLAMPIPGNNNGNSGKPRCGSNPKPANQTSDSHPDPSTGTIDLSPWKVTLPIAGSGNKPSEIKNPELAKYSSEFFIPESEGITMIVPASSSAKTANSQYSRTELREMKPGGGNADWPSSDKKSMSVTTTLLEVPRSIPTSNKHGSKAAVIIGQIHNATSAVLILRLEQNKEGSEEYSLFIQFNKKRMPNLLDTAYKVGNKVSYKISLVNDKLDVEYTNLDSKVSNSFSTPFSGTGNYFKVGCYTQTNGGEGQYKVKVSSIKLE